jgi:hypothetical protein
LINPKQPHAELKVEATLVFDKELAKQRRGPGVRGRGKWKYYESKDPDFNIILHEFKPGERFSLIATIYFDQFPQYEHGTPGVPSYLQGQPIEMIIRNPDTGEIYHEAPRGYSRSPMGKLKSKIYASSAYKTLRKVYQSLRKMTPEQQELVKNPNATVGDYIKTL